MLTKDELFDVFKKTELFEESETDFLVVDEDLNVLYINHLQIDDAAKKSTGDQIECQCAINDACGCGSKDNCARCALRTTAKSAFESKQKMTTDGSVLLEGNVEYDYHAVITPFEKGGNQYAVVLLMDRTEHNRELMMERIFFHDVLNLSGALNGILGCIEKDNHEELVEIVKGISGQLMEEINAQKDLIYARKGILETKKELMPEKSPYSLLTKVSRLSCQ